MVDMKECIRKRMIKEIKQDIDFANSLQKSSKNKYETAGRLKIDNTSATSIISLKYDAIRELLEAISILKGYKISNHICYVAFLDEIMKLDDIADMFNSFRKLRNGINYYGEDISVADAKLVLIDMDNMLEFLNKIVDKEKK